jgi:hypothetical protein
LRSYAGAVLSGFVNNSDGFLLPARPLYQPREGQRYKLTKINKSIAVSDDPCAVVNISDIYLSEVYLSFPLLQALAWPGAPDAIGSDRSSI